MRVPLNTFPGQGVNESLRQDLLALSVRYQPVAVAQDYTFRDNDEIDSLQVNATSAAVSITLPSPTGNRRRRIIKTDSSGNTVTVVGTINGVSNYTLTTQYSWVEVEPTGTSWLIVGSNFGIPPTVGYSEGTWTPSVGGTATYAVQLGHYTRIGRVVHLRGVLAITTIGTGATGIISGLPFSAVTSFSGVIGFWDTLALAPAFLAGYTDGTTFRLTGTTAANVSITDGIAVLGDGAVINFNVTYFI
jgi:hypothetical protein